MNDCSLYAQNAYSKIQSTNDHLQEQINMYIHEFTKESHWSKQQNEKNQYLKNIFLTEIELLINIAIEYCDQVRDYYNNGDDLRFYSFLEFKNLIDDMADIDNINLNMFNMSENTDNMILKHINIPLIYDNIISESYSLNHFNNQDDDDDNDEIIDTFYRNENILTDLDVLISEFYEYTDNIKKTCEYEHSILNVVKCYISELQVIVYTIIFIDSLRHI